MTHVDVGPFDPLAICKECRGTGHGHSRGRAECGRCYGAGLAGGPRALGWLRRRLNGLVELLALAQPERDDTGCRRASGDCICEICGATYYEHARDPREPYLNVLCNGWRVKL